MLVFLVCSQCSIVSGLPLFVTITMFITMFSLCDRALLQQNSFHCCHETYRVDDSGCGNMPLTLYENIKIAEQQTITHQYSDKNIGR